MKSLCKCLIISGAVIGMIAGAAGSYLTAEMLKNKMTVKEMMKCKGKEAFKDLAEKFSL